MLRNVEIRAVLSGPEDKDHLTRLFWERRIELSLDCFICERTGRTTLLEWGADRAVCSSDEEHGRHFTAARIAAFDVTRQADRVSLRTVVDFWWAPFHDVKRGVRATPLSGAPWVRLHYGYHCPRGEGSGSGSIQTNLNRPHHLRCGQCETAMATSDEAPSVRLLT
jgi:hypothetical protein